MVRIIIDRLYEGGLHYIKAAGLADDTKPSGVITGSEYIAVDTGDKYAYDEEGGDWNKTGSVGVSPEEIAAAVDAWLDAHPEATTTVEDGSITNAKLDSSLQATVADVGDLKTAIDDLEDAIANKANVDGSYPDMTVGNAEQLVATVGVEDAVPYNFRTAGGSADIGDREVDKVVGGTVAWNQLANIGTVVSESTAAGITYSADGSGKIALNGTSTGIFSNVFGTSAQITKDHVYYSALDNVVSRSSDDVFMIDGWTVTLEYGRITKAYADASGALGVRVGAAGLTFAGYYYPQIFDLTQMFGSTIADYIYSLEQATAGAGVAWFRKLFPKPYYAYNAGELMSVQTSAHKMVGFNQWDEEWEVGGISTSTGDNISQSRLRSKNRIPLIVGQTYNLHNGPEGNVLFYWYDADKNYVSSESKGTAKDQTFVAVYPYLRFVEPNITEYSNDICINLSWDGERDGEYAPYQAWEYPLDSDLVLRGIPKLDAGNNLYYDGDTYESDGTVTRRYGVVDLGTLTWTLNSSNVWQTQTSPLKGGMYAPDQIPIISQRYNPKSSSYVTGNNVAYQNGDMTCCFYNVANTTGRFYIRDDSRVSLTGEQFAASLSGIYLVYELATPTTEEADPYQNPQIVEDFGTEEYVDTRAVAIPVGHDTTYRANLRAKLEMSPNSPDGDGDYIVRQANGQNEYVLLTKELPAAPSSDGNYILKCTVASGAVTYTWEAQT